MPADHVIEVTELRRSYGTFEAVRGVSFDVRWGELFALLGTNGAGKTTTLELLEGFAPPDAGTVRVLGHDPFRERRTVRPRLGVMLQEGGFFADLTVAETVGLWRDLTPRPRPAEEILDQVRLRDRASVRARQLSGGEKRRLDLALALVGRPDVVFLDEPTAGMDPEARHTTWQTIRTLLDDGVTVLLTTHYLEEAEELADRLAIMHRGVIEAAGTVAQVVGGHGDRIRFEVPPQVAVAELPRPGGAVARIEVGGGRGERPGRAVATYMIDATPGEDGPDRGEPDRGGPDRGGPDRGGTGLRLQGALLELLRWAEDRDLELTGLEARNGSLEQAFLRIAADAATGGGEA